MVRNEGLSSSDISPWRWRRGRRIVKIGALREQGTGNSGGRRGNALGGSARDTSSVGLAHNATDSAAEVPLACGNSVCYIPSRILSSEAW